LIRLQLSPLRLAGVKKPLDILLEFDAKTVDEMLKRLTDLRAPDEAAAGSLVPFGRRLPFEVRGFSLEILSALEEQLLIRLGSPGR
jgi:hypothetical protein